LHLFTADIHFYFGFIFTFLIFRTPSWMVGITTQPCTINFYTPNQKNEYIVV